MLSVLLVDDDPLSGKLIDVFLWNAYASDYRLELAMDLPSAVEALAKRRYDAVLLDNRLGQCGNVTRTLPVLKHKLARTRLFVVTASTDDPYLRDLARMGVERVLDKADLKEEIAAGLMN